MLALRVVLEPKMMSLRELEAFFGGKEQGEASFVLTWAERWWAPSL